MFFLILISSLFSIPAIARQSFQFQAAENVQVLSDKAFRRSRENIFEAIGNVIITQGANSIYGEKATMSFATGETQVIGNVRYVAPDMTMYGSRLDYNLNSQKLDVYNARVLSDNYVVLGKRLSRVSANEIYGIDAEYTTCKDCPESWSIFGREIRVTVGEYIRIKHAYIKVKGVIVMYIPYIVLPIKKNRETGFLFPKFGLNLAEGARFQQPLFWAISEQADATATPSFFGKRGLGSELEFRHTPFDGLSYQLDGIGVNDQIYEVGKDQRTESGTKDFRYFGQWEHHLFSGKNISHHFVFNRPSDFDLSRDFQFYTNDKVLSSDTGLETYLDLRQDFFTLSLESGYRTNNLFSTEDDFDNRYVQILPKVSLSSTPFPLIQTNVPGLNRISFGLDTDFTKFKQNNISENQFLRNVDRINAVPYLDWNFGQFGPVRAKTKVVYDFQYYNLPTSKDKKWFRKSSNVYETEFSLVLEKIFGLSYVDKIPREKILVDQRKGEEGDDTKEAEKGKNDRIDSNIIGSLPSLEKGKNDVVSIQRNSYRHRQNFKLKHYFLSSQKIDGSNNFLNQVRQDNGQFDPVDTVRSEEFLANNETSRTTLPLNNTVELQWNNSLILKQVRDTNLLSDGKSLRDNFSYSTVAFFNVSQGYDLYRDIDIFGRELDFQDKLTRLFVNTGFSVNQTSFSLSEYYYYSTQESIFNGTISQAFSRGSVSASLRYNSFRVPIDKFIFLNGNLRLTDLIAVNGRWEYDLEEERSIRSEYGVTYSPVAECWMLQLGFLNTIAEKRFSFNFLINFNDNFFGMNQLQQ